MHNQEGEDVTILPVVEAVHEERKKIVTRWASKSGHIHLPHICPVRLALSPQSWNEPVEKQQKAYAWVNHFINPRAG